MDVLTLKLSLHGYIVIMLRGSSKVYTFVYSINGDSLVSTQRDSDQFEFKYAQLTQNEDNMIMVFNQKIDKDTLGVIRVCRLYDLEKDKKRDNLQNTFYPMIHQVIYGTTNPETGAHKTAKNTHRSALGVSEGGLGQAKVKMPSVMSFALSQDESKMNLFLRTGEIICFDESRS